MTVWFNALSCRIRDGLELELLGDNVVPAKSDHLAGVPEPGALERLKPKRIAES